MNGVELVQEIVEILVSGIGSLATGIGGGVSQLAENLFLTTTGTGESAVTSLSVFGTLVVVFASISLCIGLSRLIFGWIASLGARK